MEGLPLLGICANAQYRSMGYSVCRKTVKVGEQETTYRNMLNLKGRQKGDSRKDKVFNKCCRELQSSSPKTENLSLTITVIKNESKMGLNIKYKTITRRTNYKIQRQK